MSPEVVPVERLAEQLTPYVLAMTVPYVVAFAAVAAEVAWLARSDGPVRRRVLVSAATGTAMAAVALGVGVVYSAAFRFL